jgi:hypothetical protein
MVPPDSTPFSRRKFLSAAAGLTGYSLIVKAPQSLASTEDAFVVRDDISPRIDKLAPKDALPGAVAGEPNMHKVELESDLFIAGGGLAGVCAAISAARHGSKVILAQDRSRLGGNASSEIKMHPLGSQFGFREGGIIEEICLENAYTNEQNAWELWDLVLYDKVIREPNIKLLLDSSLYRAVMDGDQIESVWVRCDKTEHLYHIQSRIFLDCTGDGRLGLEAGAEFMLGRESSKDFGESLADFDEPGTTQGSSILFTAREHSRPMPFEAPSWARHLTERDFMHKRNVDRSWNYGYWWIELGGVYNTIRDNERLRFELLAIVLGVWDHIKNSGRFPKAENWALETVGMIPGKRESRRFIGDTIMTQQDIEGKWKELPDAVAFGGWTMDDHPALGFDATDITAAQQIKPKAPYNIPLGSLYSKNIPNLMFAGRNVSASHVAFTSMRLMKTCAVIGQAAGTTAHLCVRKNTLPRTFRNDSSRVRELQQILLRDGCLLMDTRNEDPADLARKAVVSASGSLGGSKPENILTGITYDPRDEVDNRWIAPMADGPAWIRLEWDIPVSVSQIQIIHDSGLGRPLEMSVHENRVKRTIYGPQPEVCRKYSIIGIGADGSEQRLESVNYNYQRLRRHTFDPVTVKAIQVVLERSNGPDLAGIYEIRAYSHG